MSPRPAPDPRGSAPRAARITDRDRELLAFSAEHRLVLAGHAQTFLRASAGVAYSRLRALTAAGLLRQATWFHRQPGCYQVTRAGLKLLGSPLPVPRVDLSCYQHDVGLAWLWLAARDGAFGRVSEIVSERQMRSSDGVLARGGESQPEPMGVRIGGVGPGGRPRIHYPDLLLVDTTGHRIGIELELSGKGRTRLDGILAAYGADRRIDAVLYLVPSAAVARSVSASARRVGVSRLVHIQRVERGEAPALSTAARQRERAASVRTASRGRGPYPTPTVGRAEVSR